MPLAHHAFMSLKKILVPLDPSPYTEGAIGAACQVAKRHDAEIAGVAVLDSPEIRSSLVPAVGPYYPLMIDAVQTKVNHADQVLKDCLDRFSRICQDAGVRHVETEYEGIPAQKLLESSICYDLVVTGLKTSFHFETRGDHGDSLDKLLERTATPVLAVPPNGMPEPKRAAIAFDGSMGSARALRDFILFAAPYDPEIVVIAADLTPAKADFLLESAAQLLRAHGFGQVDTIASEEPIEAVFADAPARDADLIVAGIHSRHRIKDLFVGSFTRHLIEQGSHPLFLSH